MFKFLHAADIHLDSPLKGLERYDGAPVEQIRQATRRAFENLVQLAINEQVSFLLIAGDLYDQDWEDYNVGLYFAKQMKKLREAGIRVYVIKGNHDAANRMTRQLRLPDNVVMLPTDRPETVVVEELGVAIHGQGFASRAVTDDLASRYPAMTRGCFNIGMLHTCLNGREGHERYAPCTIEGLCTLNYDYWALGHIHKREILGERNNIVFPGNVQGRHARETGPKGCMLVTVAENRRFESEFRCLDVLRWELCKADSTDAQHEEEVLERVADELLTLRNASDGRPLAVRVEVSGQGAARDRMLAKPQQWTNEIRSRAIEVDSGDVWIEKVVFRAQAQAAPPQFSDVALGELLEVLSTLQKDDVELQRLREELADLERKLPAQLKEGADGVKPADDVWLRNVLAQVQPLLVNRLLPPEKA